MSGANVEYSSNLQVVLAGDKISSMCLAPSSFGFSYYWNNFFWGTSNGHLYLYNEGLNTVTQVTVSGYTGTLSGSIVGLATDPAGKYLFMSAPSDGKLLRMKLSQFKSGVLTVDSNIFTFGTNTGGITINSQNTVYFITANGNAISTADNYGQGLVNIVFQQPLGSNSIFQGLILSPDETRIYTADYYTGNIYYFDFTSGQNNLQPAFAATATSRITSLANLTSADVLFTQTQSAVPGVYLYDTANNTNILIAGGGSNTVSSFAQNYQFINPNQIVVDPQGDLYITSLSPNGYQMFTKIVFNIFVRSPIAAPIPSPHFPNCGLPAPGYCKKVVIPFNPREYWGYSPAQRIPTKRPPAVGCINTVTILCPTIPPSRVNPNPPPPPVQPIAPIYPVESATTQYTRLFVTTGFMNSLRGTSGATSNIISLVDPSQSTTLKPMSFGPQGNIYMMTNGGYLTVMTTSGETVFPSFLYSNIPTAPTSNVVVVSATGLVGFVTNRGRVNVINQNSSLVYTSNLNIQSAGSPLFVDTQNMFVYAAGNTIVARETTNWELVFWSNTLVNDQFSSSLVTDGISIFVGTTGGNVVSYSVADGSLYWKYPTGNLPITQAPFTSGNLLSVFSSNTVYVLNKTPTRFGGGADTVVTLSGMGSLLSSPLLYTDQAGTTWLYFVTTSGILYAAGGFLGVQGAYVDEMGGNIGYFWKSADSNILSNITPVIDGNASLYVSYPGGIYRYRTSPTPTNPMAQNDQFGGNYYTVGTGTSVYTSPIISSQNQLSFVAFSTATGTNYIYTISSA
jgi:hypothetical protein